MAVEGSLVGDRAAVPVCEFPAVEAGGKMAAVGSLVGDRAAAFLFPVLQRGSVGKSPGEETGEGGELFPQNPVGRFRRNGIAIDGTALGLSERKVVGFPPALLLGQVQSLEGLRVGEKVGNRKLERGNMEEKGSELAHVLAFLSLPPESSKIIITAQLQHLSSAPAVVAPGTSLTSFRYHQPRLLAFRTQVQHRHRLRRKNLDSLDLNRHRCADSKSL